MEIHIDRDDAYDIRGVFMQKAENANLVISVNDPLNREIDFECYSGIYNRLHPPRSRYGSKSQYTWLGIKKDLHRTPNVKRHPEDYTWIYDPDSFHIEKWNTESIDSLVKEIRPSRDCLKQLRKTYRADDRKTIVEKLKRIGIAIKYAPRRFWNLLSKDGKLVIRLAIALGTLIAGTTVAVITILNYLNKG